MKGIDKSTYFKSWSLSLEAKYKCNSNVFLVYSTHYVPIKNNCPIFAYDISYQYSHFYPLPDVIFASFFQTTEIEGYPLSERPEELCRREPERGVQDTQRLPEVFGARARPMG